jgi:hypothetical protein
MAKKLKDQKKLKYRCPAKACPYPADFRGFPELQAYVNAEWRYRMEYCRKWKKLTDK